MSEIFSSKKISLVKNILSKWQLSISFFSLFSIALHFLLRPFELADFSTQLFSVKIDQLPLFVIIVTGGVPLLLQVLKRILQRNLGADLIAFIALALAIYMGENLTAVLVILMLASGQALEEYASHRASFALEALAKRMPSVAHLKCGNEFKDVDVSEIKVGDLLAIYPHEASPVDGSVVSGSGTMDESYLTGEPYKISKTIGSQVLSGAVNGDSLLVVCADKLPKDSRHAKIVAVMQDAKQQRPQLRRLADQMGAIFAPVALAFAFATLFFTGSLTKFLAVLTIATPCPLLIAIPITIISAISIAARRGIVIKDPAILERLSTCSTAIFDKTGTLTYGEPQLTEIVLLSQDSRQEVLQMVASLECYSRHPLASAVVKAAQKEKITLLEVENLSEKPGYGMIGVVLGKEILVSSRKKIFENEEFANIKNLDLPKLERGLECVVVIDKKPVALFWFLDAPRAESHSFINHLGPNHNFKKVILLSGDRDSEVDYLAEILGIKDAFSSQSPEQKVEIVRSETKKASTLFMGDGINDAPALFAATVGIAFGQSNNVTSESAGAVILENNLLKVDELLHISGAMRKIALQSAIGGMLLSVIGMGLAALGLISPAFGAVLQQLIDFAAILNALRLTWAKSVASDVEAAQKSD